MSTKEPTTSFIRSSISKQTLMGVLGYACHLTLVSLLGWNGILLATTSSTSTADTLLSTTNTSMDIFYSLMFLVVGVLSVKRILKQKPVPLLVIATLSSIGGTLLILLLSRNETLLLPTACLSGALIGISTSSFFMLWQIVFAGSDQSEATIEIIGGSFFAGIFFFIVVQIASSIVALIALLLCLVVSVGCLLKAYSHIDFTNFSNARETNSNETSEHTIRYFIKKLWRPALCIAALGFASSVAPIVFYNETTAWSFTNFKAIARMLSALALAVAIYFAPKNNDQFRIFFPVSFTIVATGFLLLPFLSQEYQFVFSIFTYLIFSIASMIMMMLCATEASEHKFNPLAIYGIFAGFVYLFTRTGRIISSLSTYSINFGFSQLLILALLVIYLLSIIMISTRIGSSFVSKKSNLQESKPANEKSSSNTLEETCKSIASQYRLTPRESEILIYLARGRDVSFISNDLVVSSNTIRAHCKAIYKKTGVHSRQELLSLIESQATNSNRNATVPTPCHE